MAAASEEAASPSSENDDSGQLRALDQDLERLKTVDRLNPEEDESKEQGRPLSPEIDFSNSNPNFEEEFIVLDSLNEEEIDFCSPNFNPSLALKSDKTVVPSPDIKTFKSLSSYEDAVKRRQSRAAKETAKKNVNASSHQFKSKTESKVDSKLLSAKHDKDLKPRYEKEDSSSKSRLNLKPTSSKARDNVIIESEHEKQASRSAAFKYPTKNYLTQKSEDEKGRGSTSHRADEIRISAMPRQHGRKVLRNVFTRMEAMTGPLSLLTRCVKNKEHVRVVTRGAVTLSSICRGYIVAFDKYCNMAMIDVDEIYRRPIALGKVKARISHKLLDAQETLKRERDECHTQWQANNRLTTTTNGDNKPSVPSAASDKNQQQPSVKATASTESSTTEKDVTHKIEHDLARPLLRLGSHSTQKLVQGSRKGNEMETSSKTSKLNLKLLKSVYSGVSVPHSRYEREALLLGIPDENVEHRHFNQLLLRGENVVSVSIIEEF